MTFMKKKVQKSSMVQKADIQFESSSQTYINLK